MNKALTCNELSITMIIFYFSGSTSNKLCYFRHSSFMECGRGVIVKPTFRVVVKIKLKNEKHLEQDRADSKCSKVLAYFIQFRDI